MRKLKKDESKKIIRIKKEKAKERKTQRELFDEKVYNTIKILRKDGHSYRAMLKNLMLQVWPQGNLANGILLVFRGLLTETTLYGQSLPVCSGYHIKRARDELSFSPAL